MVGDGWKPIVERLEEDLKSDGFEFQVHQVKEKFGGLRFYATMTEDRESRGINWFHERIAEAENEAERTCEVCGKPGILRTDRSWLKTLCDEHVGE